MHASPPPETHSLLLPLAPRIRWMAAGLCLCLCTRWPPQAAAQQPPPEDAPAAPEPSPDEPPAEQDREEFQPEQDREEPQPEQDRKEPTPQQDREEPTPEQEPTAQPQPTPADTPAADPMAPVWGASYPTEALAPVAQSGFVPPAPLSLPEVPYPQDGDGADHTVQLLLLLDEAGEVESVELIEGENPFARLAMEAVRQAVFRPATEDGEPVAVQVPFTWRFSPPVENLVGRVLLRGSEEPLAELPLRVNGQLVYTDTDGRFALTEVPPGEVRIELSHDTWVMPETILRIAPDEQVELDLYAMERRSDNEAVALYSPHPEPVIRRTIHAEDVRISPGTMGDAVRALQNQPGVLRTPLEAGWVLVRGGDTDDTAVFMDGVRIPQLFHLGGFTSVMHPEMIETVELYPNAYPARMGQGTAGAVELVPREAGQENKSIAGFNLVYANVYASVPVGEEGGVALAARRSYLDGAMAIVLDSERAAIAPRFWDWQGRLDTEHLDLMFLGMSDTIDAPTGNADETVRVTQTSNLFVGGVQAEALDGRAELEARAWLSQRMYDVETELLDEAETELSPGLRLQSTAELAEEARASVGVEGSLIRYSIERASLKIIDLLATTGPYAELTVGDQVRATAGVRGDVLWVPDQLPRAGLSPRGTVRWQATRRIAVVGELGQYHQHPPLLYLSGLPEGAYMGLERSIGPSGGLRYTGPRFAADADVFHRSTTNVARFEPDGSLTEGESRAWGIETWLRGTLGRFNGRVIYQFSRSITRDEPGQPFEPYRYDQPHRLLLIGALRLPKQWSLASRFRYNTGFPISGGATTAFDILQQTEIAFNLSDDRLQDFISLDIKLAKRFSWQHWQLDIYLDVQNISGRRVAEPVINGFDDTEAVYGFGLPTLPIFGLDASVFHGRDQSDR